MNQSYNDELRKYKDIRTRMMRDEPVAACKRCYDLELMGEWTMRQSHNKRKGLDYVDYIADVTNDDGSLKEFQMKYMDIRFSNICNMKCRSCGPSCSSLWSQEFLKERGAKKCLKNTSLRAKARLLSITMMI